MNNLWNKVASGRFLLTMAGATCLVALTGTVCWCLIKGIDSQGVSIIVGGILSLLSGVFTHYFTKERKNENSTKPNPAG